MLWFKKKIKFSIVRNDKTINHSVTSDLIDRVCYFSSQDYSSNLGRLPCCYGLFNPPNLYSGVGFCSKKFKVIYESQKKYDDKVFSIQPSSCDVKFLSFTLTGSKNKGKIKSLMKVNKRVYKAGKPLLEVGAETRILIKKYKDAVKELAEEL